MDVKPPTPGQSLLERCDLSGSGSSNERKESDGEKKEDEPPAPSMKKPAQSQRQKPKKKKEKDDDDENVPLGFRGGKDDDDESDAASGAEKKKNKKKAKSDKTKSTKATKDKKESKPKTKSKKPAKGKGHTSNESDEEPCDSQSEQQDVLDSGVSEDQLSKAFQEAALAEETASKAAASQAPSLVFQIFESHFSCPTSHFCLVQVEDDECVAFWKAHFKADGFNINWILSEAGDFQAMDLEALEAGTNNIDLSFQSNCRDTKSFFSGVPKRAGERWGWNSCCSYLPNLDSIVFSGGWWASAWCPGSGWK